QLAPSEVVPRIEGLRVDAPDDRWVPRELRPRRHAIEAFCGESGEVEQRGGDVHLGRRPAHPSPRPRVTGQPQDEGNAHRLAIQEDAVLLLSVIPEALAVVGRYRDQETLTLF